MDAVFLAISEFFIDTVSLNNWKMTVILVTIVTVVTVKIVVIVATVVKVITFLTLVNVKRSVVG